MLSSHGRAAFVSARIFDGEHVLENSAVLVEGGAVLGIVPVGALPPGVPRYQFPAGTIIPGLIDTHVHFMRWQGPLYLAYGVTSIRDTGNELRWILERRSEWQAQEWPRILCLGPLLDGPAPVHPAVARACADLEAAVTAVRETAAAGVDGIKLYVGMRPEWMPAVVAASHQAGRKVSAHCQAHGVLAAARAGVDEFFHLDGILADTWPDHPPGWLEVWGDPGLVRTWDRQQAVADDISRLGMTATPTLAYWQSQYRLRIPEGIPPEDRRYIPAELLRWQSEALAPSAADTWRRALRAAQRYLGLLRERGVPVLAGSDTPCGALLPGLSLWQELALLVESGMSPEQALRAATWAAADFCGRPDLGRLRAGASADLAVVRADLRRHIPERPEIVLVVRGGIVYQPEALRRAAAAAAWGMAPDPWAEQFGFHWAKKQQ